MKEMVNYSALSDQDLVSMIENHSSGDQVLSSEMEIYLLKVEYERRLILLKKTHSILDVFLSSLGIGFSLTVVFSNVFDVFSDPPLGIFLPSPNIILCMTLISVVTFISFKHLVDLPEKRRRIQRLARPNDIYIEKPNPALRLTEKDMKMLGDHADKMSQGDRLLTKAIIGNINESNSNQKRGWKTRLLIRNLTDTEFGMTSDWQLKRLLERAEASQDLVTYGKIKLEFDRRDPVTWRLPIVWIVFLLVFLTPWTFVVLADSVFHFMSEVGRDGWHYLALALSLMAAVLVKIFHAKKISFESELRAPNPPGFVIESNDPVYRWKRGEINAIYAVLRDRPDLRKEDFGSLKLYRQVKTLIPVGIAMILIIGGHWVYLRFLK